MDFGVDLYWLPLGAGGRCVRFNGRVYEAVVAALERRGRCDLYHSALVVRAPSGRYVIEMTPVSSGDHGVVAGGAVGSPLLRRSRLFRYEIRRWRDGEIPDVAEAVDSPRTLTRDPATAQRLLDRVRAAPTPTWGRDELCAGEMWNSNSLVSWLLVVVDIDPATATLPAHGRAPGWDAGIVVARRQGGRGMNRLRHWVLNWGATADESTARLPGDELLEHADGVATRAMTVDAPASAVWPWIAQMGPSPRGGAYTYDWIENLLGLNMHSVDTVLPEFQHPQVGQSIGLGANVMRYAVVDPGHVLALRSADGNWVWTFVLDEREGKTRLISRNRFRLPRLRDKVGMIPMEPASLVMERRMLRGIKKRAERLAATR